MIDEDRTMQLYGYTSDMLSKFSRKPIVKVCDECGEYKIVKKSAYRDLCVSCSHKGEHKLPKPKFVKDQDRFIPNTQIDRILTIEKYGYDPVDLTKGSHKLIVRICQQCGKNDLIEYKTCYNLCHSCSMIGKNLGKNLGKKRSEKIKQQQSARMQHISYDEWESYAKENPYCEKFNKSCREKNRNKYNRECFICGKDEENNGKKLSVHHIDMNKNQGCNDNQWKLVPLCISCHGKTHNKIWENRLKYLLKGEIK